MFCPARLSTLPLFAASFAASFSGGCIDYFAELPPRPDAAQPDMAQPDMAQPDMARPDMTQPDMAQPDMARPDMTQPDMAQPDMTQRGDACVPTELSDTDSDEACNGMDDDCDGVADEANDLPVRPAVGLMGVCEVPVLFQQCRDAGWYNPGPEEHPLRVDEVACDGLDNDCDGDVDETRGDEQCDDIDNDCDGMVDEARDLNAIAEDARNQDGVCAGRKQVCVAGRWQEPAIEGERCDDGEPFDNDCDGYVDEDLVCAAHCRGGEDVHPCNGCPAGTVVPAGWVCIPAGTFEMGKSYGDDCQTEPPPEGEPQRCRETPPWNVRISRPFLMKANEVTRGEWAELYREQGAEGQDLQPHLAGDGSERYPGCIGSELDEDVNERCPLSFASWQMAVQYLNDLSVRDNLPPCYTLGGCIRELTPASCADQRNHYCTLQVALTHATPQECPGYRLPTEAEWEYAARATSRELWPVPLEALSTIACYRSDPNQPPYPCAVGSRSHNEWGLYDMLGNVAEWVFAPSTLRYPGSLRGFSVSDPFVAFDVGMNYPVARGGGFDSPHPGSPFEEEGNANQLRLTAKEGLTWCHRGQSVGFRVVRSLP